jgi:hypothetical protein
LKSACDSVGLVKCSLFLSYPFSLYIALNNKMYGSPFDAKNFLLTAAVDVVLVDNAFAKTHENAETTTETIRRMRQRKQRRGNA